MSIMLQTTDKILWYKHISDKKNAKSTSSREIKYSVDFPLLMGGGGGTGFYYYTLCFITILVLHLSNHEK